MSLHTQALVFNGVPLVVLAVLYLGVTAALAPLVLRERFVFELPLAAEARA